MSNNRELFLTQQADFAIHIQCATDCGPHNRAGLLQVQAGVSFLHEIWLEPKPIEKFSFSLPKSVKCPCSIHILHE